MLMKGQFSTSIWSEKEGRLWRHERAHW